MWLWATYCSWPCFEQGTELDNLQRCLHTSATLWDSAISRLVGHRQIIIVSKYWVQIWLWRWGEETPLGLSTSSSRGERQLCCTWFCNWSTVPTGGERLLFPIKLLWFSIFSLNCTDSVSYFSCCDFCWTLWLLHLLMYFCRSGSSLEARLSCETSNGTNKK